VHAEDAEYWDRADVQAVKYALEAAKAYVTGKRPESGPDQHAEVKL
jgi:hypothetical protein